MVAPGATPACDGPNAMSADSTTPPSDTSRPRPIAANSVLRKARVTCWDVATGTTIRALTSSRPTVRMATVTVTAAITETSRW